MPIQKSNSDFTANDRGENGIKQSLKTSNGARFYAYTLRNQIKGHEYECAISIVAKGTVGEFTTAMKTANVAGDDYNAVAEVKPIPPAIQVKKTQSILNWSLKTQVSVSSQRIPFTLNSDSGLPVSVISNSQSICLISGAEIVLVKAGRCVVTASQSGDSTYLAAVDRIFVVDLMQSKATTITCVKGKIIKKVTGIKPICQVGYKKK